MIDLLHQVLIPDHFTLDEAFYLIKFMNLCQNYMYTEDGFHHFRQSRKHDRFLTYKIKDIDHSKIMYDKNLKVKQALNVTPWQYVIGRRMF
jgi:hypothetical protein